MTDKFGTELSIGDKVAFINGKTDWRQTPRFIKGTITGYNPTKNWFQVEEDLTTATHEISQSKKVEKNQKFFTKSLHK